MGRNYAHYQEYFNSFLGGWSFADGDRTLTIKSISEEEMFDAKTQEKKTGLCLRFFEEQLPMVLNKTNAEMIASVIGSDATADWIGKKIVVGTSKVKAFGKVNDAIRVRNQNPNKIIKCEECGGEVKGAAGRSAQEIAEIAVKNCGKVLCLDCQRKYKAKMEAGNGQQDDTSGQADKGSGTEADAE